VTETGPASPQVLLLVGALLLASLLLKGALRRPGIPPLVGYLLLGLLLSAVDWRWGLLSSGAREALEFLGGVGIVVLLFRVGLESNVRGLAAQLPRAGRVWLGDVLVSGGLGYVAARYALGAALVPSLFVAAALMATSVSISVSVWEEAGALGSRNGELLLDVAEADDISSVVAMVLLFAAVPVLAGRAGGALGPALASAAAGLGLKALAFAAGCLVFARYLERPMTALFRRLTDTPDPVIVMAGAGLAIASLAGALGLSLAVGALLAGLLYSRDPEAVRMEPSFRMLYDLFTPFFFIGVGLLIEPGVLGQGLLAGGLLLVPAVVGKVVGAGFPALLEIGWSGGALIGVSMIPRAEIAMIVAGHGRALGDWAVPPEIFAGLMAVALASALLTPPVLRLLLARWPQPGGSPP